MRGSASIDDVVDWTGFTTGAFSCVKCPLAEANICRQIVSTRYRACHTCELQWNEQGDPYGPRACAAAAAGGGC
eukprot:COSAG03_NODE_786_length_5865_cov_4.427159_7_plen_74_part_00